MRAMSPAEPTAESDGATPPQGPSLSVAAVARRLGVAPATLRTWDRRYGVGPSSHNAGAHRRYAPADVEVLAAMQRMTLAGVPPAEAARTALAGGTGIRPAPPDRTPPGGGGRVLALPGARPSVRGLARAAMALDAETSKAIVSEQLERYGTAITWDQLLVPVLVGIGERWDQTGIGVEVEHVLSESVLAALHATRSSGRPRGSGSARPVLLAGAPEEQHTLPLHVLSGVLEERGVTSRLMGARVPQVALADAVRRSGACAVFLWAHRPEVLGSDTFARIPSMRPAVDIVVGGLGWEPPLPENVVQVHSLAEAVEALTRSALG